MLLSGSQTGKHSYLHSNTVTYLLPHVVTRDSSVEGCYNDVQDVILVSISIEDECRVCGSMHCFIDLTFIWLTARCASLTSVVDISDYGYYFSLCFDRMTMRQLDFVKPCELLYCSLYYT